VVRRLHPSDRRKVLVELTSRARDTLTAMFAFSLAATAHAAGSLSPSELGIVLQFLHDVTHAYERTDPVAGVPDDFVGRGDASTDQRATSAHRSR